MPEHNKHETVMAGAGGDRVDAGVPESGPHRGAQAQAGPEPGPAVQAEAAAAYAAAREAGAELGAETPAAAEGEPVPQEGEPVPAEGEPVPQEGEEHTHMVRDLDELAARAGKADEYLELAQRTRADFENYRRIATRKAAEAQDRGVAKLAKELLPAIDNLDRALQAAEGAPAMTEEDKSPAGDSQLMSGIKLVHADVLAALARVGIEPFSPEGQPFDPTLHEAVAQAPFEGAASGTVVEVYQRGYRLGETVLRPARVVVAA